MDIFNLLIFLYKMGKVNKEGNSLFGPYKHDDLEKISS